MENINRIYDCCDADYSHGMFSRMIRKALREFAALENHLSIGLTVVIAVILIALIKLL